MYNIKAMVPGIFCLDLEEGSINIRPGQTVNLELLCSRQWIENDPGFQALINRKPPVLMVVFDSAKNTVSKVNLKSVSQKNSSATLTSPVPVVLRQSKATAKKVEPVVSLPIPVSDVEPIVIDLVTHATTKAKTEVATEPATLTVEDITKKYTESELRKLYLNDLKLLAASLNISITPPISKIRLVKSILQKYGEGAIAVNM